MKLSISRFIKMYYLHFSVTKLIVDAKGYVDDLNKGSKMMITLAGGMSTPELEKSLAKMIYHNKVSIILSTSANLEEYVINLVAHSYYQSISNYRYLSAEEEKKLLKKAFNRVIDTCIPEKQALKRLEKYIFNVWKEAKKKKECYFFYEVIYKILFSSILEKYYQINAQDRWMLVAHKKKITIIVLGWENAIIGHIFTSYCMKKKLKIFILKFRIEYMIEFANWYCNNSSKPGLGFLQIEGGIAGDCPICVVRMMYQDLAWNNILFWSYCCQISDSITSYGRYSGVHSNEKNTWGKLEVNTPKFIIESDVTIVAALIFGYVLAM